MPQREKVARDKSQVVAALPLACSDEAEAVAFLERQRWGGSPACPRCGDMDVYQMTDRKTGERNKDWRWRCRGCKRMYTVRTGTVFEDSRIQLRWWLYAFWRACSSKKGVSALQIRRETGLSYKSALFLMHRIRWAMAPTEHVEKLSGVVEVDETYVGGRPRPQAGPRREWSDRFGHRLGQRHTGRGTPKTPVVALVQRDGEIRTRIVADVTARSLRGAIREYVESVGAYHDR